MVSDAIRELIQLLRQRLGDDCVVLDEDTLQLYSQDIYSIGETVSLVVRPASTEELATAVELSSAKGVPVYPRGGGMSYTGGYLSSGGDAMLVDMSAMDSVLEIDEDNMVVRVQTGCSWKKLHAELSAKGLRTRYWGTLSGHSATVGGGLSNNSIFWGSGQYGTAAESVLGLEVVLADGSVMRTGAGAQVNNEVSFMRNYGPDLTGIFLCDCGALGIKAVAELPLIDELKEQGYASYDFADAPTLLAAMAEISRRSLASECFGFDPELQNQRMKRASLAEDLRMAGGVVRTNRLWTAFTSLIKLALFGRRFAEDTQFTLHCIVSDTTAQGVERNLKQIARIASENKGRRIPDSIPRIMGANPFPPLNNIAGALGERWAPVHGLFAHSRAEQGYRATAEVFASHASSMSEHGITAGYLFSSISQQVSVLEPVFFWEDELKPLHKRTIDAQVLKGMPGFAESLEGRAQVDSIRRELAKLYSDLGATHLQIGRSYLYREGVPSANWSALQVLKNHLDPQGLMNPGALER